MHFSAVVIAGLAAFANAQDSSSSSSETATSTTSTSTTTTYALTPAQSSQASCLGACAEGDVNCQASCIAVPSPDAAAANATVNCVADCNQGNGTAESNAAYGVCVQDCIDQNYYSSTGAPAGSTATGAAGGNGGSSGSATATGASASGSGSSSSTGASSTSTSSSTADSAAAMVRVGGSAVGLLVFMAAFLAM